MREAAASCASSTASSDEAPSSSGRPPRKDAARATRTSHTSALISFRSLPDPLLALAAALRSANAGHPAAMCDRAAVARGGGPPPPFPSSTLCPPCGGLGATTTAGELGALIGASPAGALGQSRGHTRREDVGRHWGHLAWGQAMLVDVAHVRLQGRGSQLHSALVPSRLILGAIRHPAWWRLAKSARHGPRTLEGEVTCAVTRPTRDASDGGVFTIRRKRTDDRRRRRDVRPK